jgi:hypothetical protein
MGKEVYARVLISTGTLFFTNKCFIRSSVLTDTVQVGTSFKSNQPIISVGSALEGLYVVWGW